MNILIDTDPGQDIDDVLALWFALRHPALAVRAITTVTYPSEARAKIARRLTELLGKDTSVGAGMQTPMRVFGADERTFQYDLSKSMNHTLGEPADTGPFPDARKTLNNRTKGDSSWAI